MSDEGGTSSYANGQGRGAYDVRTALDLPADGDPSPPHEEMKQAMFGDTKSEGSLPSGAPISWAGTSVPFPWMALELRLKTPAELAKQVAEQRAAGIVVTEVPLDLEEAIAAAGARHA